MLRGVPTTRVRDVSACRAPASGRHGRYCASTARTAATQWTRGEEARRWCRRRNGNLPDLVLPDLMLPDLMLPDLMLPEP